MPYLGKITGGESSPILAAANIPLAIGSECIRSSRHIEELLISPCPAAFLHHSDTHANGSPQCGEFILLSLVQQKHKILFLEF